MTAAPKAVVVTGGILASWTFAKSILNRGGADRDNGAVGYGMNLAGGLLYAVGIGAIFRKREWFQLGIVAAITAPLLRVSVDFLKGKDFSRYGIRTGFEDYVLVQPGMSDFLTLARGRNNGVSDWLTAQHAESMGSLVEGDTIRRYGDE